MGVTAKLIAIKRQAGPQAAWRSTSWPGLLHDIGKIPLNNKLSTEYVQALALTDREHMPLYRPEERTMEVQPLRGGQAHHQELEPRAP